MNWPNPARQTVSPFCAIVPHLRQSLVGVVADIYSIVFRFAQSSPHLPPSPHTLSFPPKKRQLSVFILGARVTERTQKNVPTNKISIYAIFPPFLQIQHIRPRNWNATTATTTSGGDRLTVWLTARQTTSIPSHEMKQRQQQQRAMYIWRVIC